LFEIEGVRHAVLCEFSRRRVEIEQRAFELTGAVASRLSRERLQGIALATRKVKEYGVDGARWRQEAIARAAEHGLGESDLKHLLRSPARTPGRSETDVAVVRRSAPEGLTAQHNTSPLAMRWRRSPASSIRAPASRSSSVRPAPTSMTAPSSRSAALITSTASPPAI
jgi:hypothetical protein